MGKIQMDVTDEDLTYFKERGFDQGTDDLNRVARAQKHGWLEDLRSITGRPHGWVARRTVWNTKDSRIIRNWYAPVSFNNPISAYIDAELRGWRYDGEDDGHTDQQA